jgi:hypothetical protein
MMFPGSISVQTTGGTNFILLPGSTFNMFPEFFMTRANQLSMAGLSLLPPGATLLPPSLFMGASPFSLAAAINPAIAPGASFLAMLGGLSRPTSAFLSLAGMTGPIDITGGFPMASFGNFSSFGLTSSATPGGFMTIQASALGNSQAASATTVWSGSDLNVVLDDLKQLQTKGLEGRDVTVPEDVLQHINIVPKNSHGNAGMLKNFGRAWPELLKASDFQSERDRIETLLPKLAEQAKTGQVNAADLESLIEAKESMEARLATQIQDVPDPQYVRAKRFLDNLQDGIRVLRRSDAAKYLSSANAPTAKTVRELAQYMNEHDLRFAPAVAGDEAAYLKLYQALAIYDVVANRAANGDNMAMTTK